MQAELVFALKKIAELGGIENWVEVSTHELGCAMGKSQQSASLYIKQLQAMGFVERLPGKRTKIKITESGVKELTALFKDLEKILYGRAKFEILGTVTAGMGEGRYYLDREQYAEQFFEIFGFRPYPGTLNIRVEKEYVPQVLALKEKEGIMVKGFVEKDRTYGDVKCFRCTLAELPCVLVFPSRSHYTDVIEIVSRYHLRKSLKLNDGDRVLVRVNLDAK
jgi:riboflavin kinase